MYAERSDILENNQIQLHCAPLNCPTSRTAAGKWQKKQYNLTVF